MERKKKKESGGIYIALCCCALVIAIVGYANRISLKEETPNINIAQQDMAQQQAQPRENIENKKDDAPQNTKVSVTSQSSDSQTISDTVSSSVTAEDTISFNAPVKGKVCEDFSGDDLVYNETLRDWRSHSGVDFSAESGEQVFCSANGVVEDIFDSELGRCVTINHRNGYITMYANLSEDTSVKKGDEISQGDVVGIVGNTALGDATEEPHVHFEIMKEGKNLNPTDFLE